MDPDDEDLLDPDAINALPGEPVAVIEQEPGIFKVGEYTFVTNEVIVWAIGRQLPNRQALVAYRVDFDASRATVTVATLNPDGTSHESDSHLMDGTEADRVMLALVG